MKDEWNTSESQTMTAADEEFLPSEPSPPLPDRVASFRSIAVPRLRLQDSLFCRRLRTAETGIELEKKI
jgi:hypothetical protein